MSRRPADPLAGVGVVIVDASNLLHALQRGPAPLPPAALVGRIRAVIPPIAGIELIFDGPSEPGMRRTHVASGVQVRYAAPASADEAIVARARSLDAEARDRLLVVSDDGELRRELERLGARVARTAWLIGRLDRGVLSAPAAGNRRPAGLRRPAGIGNMGGTTPGRRRGSQAAGGANRHPPNPRTRGGR